MNFLQKVLKGTARVEEIDDYVERWHHSSSSLDLPEFLGLSREEYANWVEHPESLKKVVSKRKEPACERFVDSVLLSQREFLVNLSKDLSRGNISFSQFYLISYLSTERELSLTDIARKMGHSVVATTNLVDRLAKLGYVERSPAAEDRRKIVARITAKGTALVERLRATLRNRVAEAIEETESVSSDYDSGKRQTRFHDFVSALWQLEEVKG